MGFFTYYFIFATATAITSCYFFFWPLLMEARDDNINNQLADRPVLSATVYTLIGIVIAPVLFYILLMPPAAESYVDGLRIIVREEKN
jgi:hypothetical protein